MTVPWLLSNFYEMLPLWWGTAATSDEFHALFGNRSFPNPPDSKLGGLESFQYDGHVVYLRCKSSVGTCYR